MFSAKMQKMSDKPKIRMCIKGFEAIHGAERSGVNEEAGLLELLSRYHDLSNAKVEKLPKGKRTLYIEYYTKEAAEGIKGINGLTNFIDTKSEYYLTIKKGKDRQKVFFQVRDKEGNLQLPEQYIAVIGKVAAAQLLEFKFEYELRSLCAVSDFRKLPDTLEGNAFVSSLHGAGWTILDGMKFHASFTFKSEFIRQRNKSIEFGYYEGGDYCSLPRMIRLDFQTELKVVTLKNVEKKGKDGHHAHYVIRAEQASLVKNFARSFKRKKELMGSL